ncbi:MAG: UDP-N-acetylmuramate dehydrogenase [Verrucomicrobiota bacterium]|nr:UDP-N-acetylmuramate dehydrogenase [Limisphaera sp.]MDW8381693.1 UDP-N-acetylmuramate dehydrogenase [Verrucomicrobiota bacterium]
MDSITSKAAAVGKLLEQLQRNLSPQARILRDEPLARRTTWRVGGPADLWVEPADEADLGWVVRLCREMQVPLLVIGRGSNLLVHDAGFRGVVVALSQDKWQHVKVWGNRLDCGAGARLKAVALAARDAGLSGLEFLEGIPGSVGGALRMNAGAMGSSMFDVVETVRFMDADGRVEDWPAERMDARYRACEGLKGRIALAAVLRGQPAPREQIQERMRLYSERRWATQPAAPSAGCVFKNPPGMPAGMLLDRLGCKGWREGGARVSSEHANFIVTEPGATAADVMRLIRRLQEHVRLQCGVELEPEVLMVGEEGPWEACWSAS